MTKKLFVPQVDEKEYLNSEHRVSLTGSEISTILFYLEGIEDDVKDINTIFSKLEGLTNRWYNFQESMLINQHRKDEDLQDYDDDEDGLVHDSEGC